MIKLFKRLLKVSFLQFGIWSWRIGKKNIFKFGVRIYENSIIGNNNYFGFNTQVNNARIGNYCSIANNVSIGPAMHSLSYLTTYHKLSKELISDSLNKSQVNVGHDVWCGSNSVIMQGLTIGNGSVIGSNAVVTKNIPPYSIVVGVPAKIIKYRFSEQVIKILINSNWYELDFYNAKKLLKSLETKIREEIYK
jgi:acetyltransferase-like isoleucine patch superfamily enzyme